jgi:hypothetical protein
MKTIMARDIVEAQPFREVQKLPPRRQAEPGPEGMHGVAEHEAGELAGDDPRHQRAVIAQVPGKANGDDEGHDLGADQELEFGIELQFAAELDDADILKAAGQR